jgi:fimbrial isopeptide formation D2 family protein
MIMKRTTKLFVVTIGALSILWGGAMFGATPASAATGDVQRVCGNPITVIETHTDPTGYSEQAIAANGGEQPTAGQPITYERTYCINITDNGATGDGNGSHNVTVSASDWVCPGIGAANTGAININLNNALVPVAQTFNSTSGAWSADLTAQDGDLIGVHANDQCVSSGNFTFNVQATLNIADEEITFPKPTISIDKDDGVTSVKRGDVLNYRIVVANTTERSDAIENAVVTDVLPAYLTVDESSISNGGTYDAATRTITWTIATLRYGEDITLTFSATVDENAPNDLTEITNLVSVNAPDYDLTASDDDTDTVEAVEPETPPDPPKPKTEDILPPTPVLKPTNNKSSLASPSTGYFDEPIIRYNSERQSSDFPVGAAVVVALSITLIATILSGGAVRRKSVA